MGRQTSEGTDSTRDLARRLDASCDALGTRLFRARRRLQLVLTARFLRPQRAISARPALASHLDGAENKS